MTREAENEEDFDDLLLEYHTLSVALHWLTAWPFGGDPEDAIILAPERQHEILTTLNDAVFRDGSLEERRTALKARLTTLETAAAREASSIEKTRRSLQQLAHVGPLSTTLLFDVWATPAIAVSERQRRAIWHYLKEQRQAHQAAGGEVLGSAFWTTRRLHETSNAVAIRRYLDRFSVSGFDDAFSDSSDILLSLLADATPRSLGSVLYSLRRASFIVTHLRLAMRTIADHVMSLQSPDGSWHAGGPADEGLKADAFSTALLTAALLSMDRLPGLEADLERAVSWLLANQSSDGSLRPAFARREGTPPAIVSSATAAGALAFKLWSPESNRQAIEAAEDYLLGEQNAVGLWFGTSGEPWP